MMKSRTKTKIIISIILATFFTFSTIFSNDIIYNMGYGKQNLVKSGNTNLNNKNLKISKVSEPIIISNNNDWYILLTDGLCTGLGTSSDPFVIEDLVIDGRFLESCILIENSDVYFIIRNCTVYNARIGWGVAGIRLINVKNGNLNHNNCTSNFVGIEINGKNIDISDNNIDNNINTGILIGDCSNLIISGNTIKKNSEIGIYAQDCKAIAIKENAINENGWSGIYIGEGSDNIISRNNLNYDNEVGIFINGNGNVISDNIITNNNVGVSIGEGSRCNKISNNIFSNNGEDIVETQNFCIDNILIPLIIGITVPTISIVLAIGILVLKRKSRKKGAIVEIPYKKGKSVEIPYRKEAIPEEDLLRAELTEKEVLQEEEGATEESPNQKNSKIK